MISVLQVHTDTIISGEITMDLNSDVIEIEVVVLMILNQLRLMLRQDMRIFGLGIHFLVRFS